MNQLPAIGTPLLAEDVMLLFDSRRGTFAAAHPASSTPLARDLSSDHTRRWRHIPASTAARNRLRGPRPRRGSGRSVGCSWRVVVGDWSAPGIRS